MKAQPSTLSGFDLDREAACSDGGIAGVPYAIRYSLIDGYLRGAIGCGGGGIRRASGKQLTRLQDKAMSAPDRQYWIIFYKIFGG